MKSPLLFFISIFLLLQSIGCRKETGEPVTDAIVPTERVSDTTHIPDVTASPGEIIIENLTWIVPWYNSVEIIGFNKMLPAGTVFKIFIQRHNITEWNEVPLIKPDSNLPISYEYFVETRPDGAGMYNFGSLYIFYYGSDVNDHPGVKIVY